MRMCVYIYIYRERERCTHIHIHTSLSLSIYIYIYVRRISKMLVLLLRTDQARIRRLRDKCHVCSLNVSTNGNTCIYIYIYIYVLYVFFALLRPYSSPCFSRILRPASLRRAQEKKRK